MEYVIIGKLEWGPVPHILGMGPRKLGVVVTPSLAMLCARLTIATTVTKNCSFAECVLGKSAALVLILSQEASKHQW